MMRNPKNNGAFSIEWRMNLGHSIHLCPFYCIMLTFKREKASTLNFAMPISLDRRNILQPVKLVIVLNLVKHR